MKSHDTMSADTMIRALKSWIHELRRPRLGATGDSWKDPRIPAEQRRLVDEELEQLRKGNVSPVYLAAVRALQQIPGDEPMTLLEMGCASGYYFEVLRTLIGARFQYHGADYSEAMLELARKKYPEASFQQQDIRKITLPDRSFDIVLSGAVIVHVKEWSDALREMSRVARRYFVLHRTPVGNAPFHQEEGLSYAGVPILFNRFNRKKVLEIVEQEGFRMVYETVVYPDSAQNDVKDITFLFERLS